MKNYGMYALALGLLVPSAAQAWRFDAVAGVVSGVARSYLGDTLVVNKKRYNLGISGDIVVNSGFSYDKDGNNPQPRNLTLCVTKGLVGAAVTGAYECPKIGATVVAQKVGAERNAVAAQAGSVVGSALYDSYKNSYSFAFNPVSLINRHPVEAYRLARFAAVTGYAKVAGWWNAEGRKEVCQTVCSKPADVAAAPAATADATKAKRSMPMTSMPAKSGMPMSKMMPAKK